ncbi:MAG: acyltransferase family protein [Roseofilum sp. SBFL]|nr:acyltransferase family protein [Roseofilum sp. SID2]MBP0011976.1 acyltransferase family protein [Roseofilum sp. SID3]MBP0037474.1 acyltransferase family protein [Roseofilum sp. SID1]MBP0044737.1 acyltransferase family protein [Roseofilum sp. SBFL]
MRSVGISTILLYNLPDYCFKSYRFHLFGTTVDLSQLHHLSLQCSLGLLVFLAGSLINRHQLTFPNIQTAGKFLFKKLAKLFPLYYLSLALFCYLYSMFDWTQIMIHVLGLQLIFASDGYSPLPTLWYVGLILVYYSLFSLLNIHKISVLYKVAILAFFVVILCVCSTYLQIADGRLITYSLPFLGGILAAKNNLFDARVVRKAALINPGLFCVIFSLCFVWQHNYNLTIEHNAILLNLLMFSFVLLIYRLSNFVCQNAQVNQFLHTIAYCAYGIFLFHRPIWFALEKMMRSLFLVENVHIITASLVFLGIPLIVGVSYVLLTLYDRYGITAWYRPDAKI